ncbi:MAG TPA: DinB family protein [Thermoanaerobaculia bacterium]|nr:DinB family protein [Thermoanaerobaculia bacterium]
MAASSPGPVVEPRYAAALGGDDPVSVMAETPDRIRRLIRGLTEKQLETKPAPGKWCIKEIVAHLADGEVILGSRYRFIGAHDRPPLPGYDQDAFVERLGPMNAKAADLADDFAMARAANLGLLERLPEEAWDRVGLHSERGEESIRSLVAMYAGHDRHHLAQIETIRTGLFPKSGKQRAARRAAKTARKKAPKRR